MSYKWVKKWKAESSKAWRYNWMGRPIPSYTVSLSVDGAWGCSCKGWVNRHTDCRHIMNIKHRLGWNKLDSNAMLSHLIELQALRVTQLRERGKSEEEIERDLEACIEGTNFGEDTV